MPKDTVITLSSANYDELEWWYINQNIDSNLNNIQSSVSLKGYGIVLSTVCCPSNVHTTVLRTMGRVSDTQYKVNTIQCIGHVAGSNHSASISNVGRYLVPYKIYGIKYQ